MAYQQHPLSAAYPAMSAEDFQSLKDSITNIGVQNPITIFDGMVIDGWHRYTAATDLGMDCPTVELGDVDPRDFVQAVNDARRHMTQSARALALTAVYAWKPVGNPSFTQLNAERSIAKTNAELAKIAGVGVQSIREAKTVHKSAEPEVVAAVKSGEIGLPKAAAIAKLPKEEQAAAIHKPAPKAAPEAPPAPTNHELEEAVSTINELAAENDQLRDRVAVAAMSGTDEERAMAAETIAELREQIKTLEAELDAVRTSRDSFQRQNAELMKQVRLQQKQIKKLGG